ncbi:UPF0515 protein [Biomphalaria pfeifferi]|uniref:UPF0515 protein n=1 Tax=Biomphalaria pfeifferi TaxID=112525 RepID=A0AAD8BDT5_BIOPF|nr:UPF0515 protein [Biomphalaria pfeifferi]
MEDKEVRLEACQLRELFKGRFSQDEMEKVVREMGGKLQALDFILRVDSGQVSGFLKKSTQYIENLQRDSIHLNEVLESGVFDVETSKRQFGCKECQRSWWRKVPLRKEVSTCHVCKTRYDAIPRDKEWGWGMFYCDGENCGEEFQGFAVMGMTKSMCHRCGYYVLVDHIIPPNKFSRNKKKRTRDTHDFVFQLVTGSVVFQLVTGSVVFQLVTGSVVFQLVTGSVVFQLVTGSVVFQLVTGSVDSESEYIPII